MHRRLNKSSATCACLPQLLVALLLPGSRVAGRAVCCCVQGLRERNWTTQWYDPAAEKWELKFFEDRCSCCRVWVWLAGWCVRGWVACWLARRHTHQHSFRPQPCRACSVQSRFCDDAPRHQ